MSASSSVEPLPQWSLATRIAFRFAFAFFVLFNLPSPFDRLPGVGAVFEWLGWLYSMWDEPIRLLARVIGVNAPQMPNGSGDTTYHWLHLLCVAIAAVLIALVWSVIDRKRLRYDRAYVLFRMYLRFTLALAMFSYGIAKIIPQQFPAPTLDRLLQPYGDSSPMGLLWTFMGVSRVYSFFGGAGELLGGLLLTTRRTTLLGALVSAAVLTNVVVLNFAYDVPVKIYSSTLLLMALTLAVPDLRRLADFFVLHRPVVPAPLPRLTNARWTEVAGIVMRTLLVAAVIFMGVKGTLAFSRIYTTRSPIYGMWSVDKAASSASVAGWSRVVFENKGWMGLMLDGNSRRRIWVFYQPASSFNLTTRNEPQWVGKLTYAMPDKATLVLDGTCGGKAVHVVAHREPFPQFLLTSRGFHWINDYPFNR